MAEYVITQSFSNIGNRNDVRMRVVNKLSEEEYGSGRGNLASKYTYYVETLGDGNRVFLRRPANLYNGFDFIVCVESIDFDGNGRNRPKHEDIFYDLAIKAEENYPEYEKLFNLMNDVYRCTNDIDYTETNKLSFSSGLPCDLILAVLKWLFIEQDIRYWNYSGRDMLWNGIKEIE
ncbi:hypothetical protein AGMMS4956_19380 [Bacteroidia bacterium]|nr:hypothetical protein AGMMS4956_19380 [Bacteroidia bacterium]